MPFDLTQSPRTQAMAGGQPQGGDAEDFFNQGFSAMSYGALSKSNPDLINDVITFRILESDPDEGTGVGVFVLKHNQDMFYVPVVVSDNNVKPLDVFYSRRLDRYYPLTKEWLQEASKSNLGELGEGVKAPKTLPTDVDIRNLVVPPTTGRYSYASAREPLLPKVLGAAPNAVKVAFANVLRKNPALLEKAAGLYGVAALRECLAPRAEKAASVAEMPMKHDVFVASLSTPIQFLKDELDPAEVGRAYKAIRTYGFYAKDRRKSTDKLMVAEESTSWLTEPTEPGLYVVHLADGGSETVLVVPNPVCAERGMTDEQKATDPSRAWDGRVNPNRHKPAKCFLVLFKDGRYAECKSLVAEPVPSHTRDDVRAFVDGAASAGSRPKNGERGALVCADGQVVRAVEPVYANKVTSGSDQTSFTADYGTKVVVSERVTGSKVMKPVGDDLLVVSKSFRWWPCKDRLGEEELLRSPRPVLMALEAKMLREGATPVTVKRASHGFYVGADRTRELPVHVAVEKVARDYNVTVPEAVALVKRAVDRRTATGWVVKRAADDKKKSSGGDEPSPEEQQMMMQQQMAAQQPPQPSGLDLAVSEQMQVLQQQMAAIQQQMQMLQTVQARAQGIDQGGGTMAAPMGAASMMAGPPPGPGGMPAMAPVGGAPPGMDPSMTQGGMQGGMQGMPPAMGVPPGAQQMPGGMQPGMDPSMMQGGGQPGMDPSMMQPPPPQATMTEDLTPENIEGQINPQFLDDAAGLEDSDVFDAAAIASLAAQKNLRSLTQAYVPALERALDNLGRIKLVFDLREGEIKQKSGNETYQDMEDTLRDTFRGLGDLLLRINQNSQQLLPQSGRA